MDKSGTKQPARAYPAWLGKLTQRDEARRRGAGLYPAKDGWYKTIQLKKRYIAKPMPLGDALAILPTRIAEIEGHVEERPARLAAGSTTIDQLAEMFIAHLWQRHTTGMPKKLARRTYDDYCDTLSRFVECAGPDAMAITAGPDWFTRFARAISRKAATSRRRDIIYITAFFNWAGPGRHALNFYRTPVNFGPDLVKPDESEIRTKLAESSTQYSPEQYLAALMAVRECPLLFAAGLLGLNCAFYASDISLLPASDLDLEKGLHWFPRPKTKIKRKAVLMPETIWAIRRYLETRPPLAEGVDRVFVREDGRPFNVRRNSGPDGHGSHGDSLGAYWSGITGLPFKGLRTTFATAADGFVDQQAVDLIMGHAAKSIRAKHYVKQFAPQRLAACIEHVWQQCVSAIPLPAEASISAVALLRRGEPPHAAASRHPKRRARSGTAAA
jgi:integrase